MQISPAALTDVVPAGAIDVTVGAPPAARRAQAPSLTKAPPAAEPRKRMPVECTYGGARSPELLLLDHELKLNASTRLSAGWSWGLPPTITLEAEQKLWADYKISGILGAAAQCELLPTSITPEFLLGQYSAVVGGVPVVISAMGGAQATGKVRASAGLRSTFTARATATARLKARNTQITPSGGIDITSSKPGDVIPTSPPEPKSKSTPTSTSSSTGHPGH